MQRVDTTEILNLPEEILISILANLNPAQLAKVKRVCKTLDRLVTSKEFINSAATYTNYRGSYRISSNTNAFKWDRKAELFEKMKKNCELRTNFGYTPSMFTVTHEDKAYIIREADSNKHLGYFGYNCYKVDGFDESLPHAAFFIHENEQLAVLVQDKYVLISQSVSDITLFDGKTFGSQKYFLIDREEATKKNLKNVSFFCEEDKFGNMFRETTLSILPFGGNKFLSISKKGSITTWEVTCKNQFDILPTREIHQIELQEDTTIQRATITKNKNILFACSGSIMKIIDSQFKLIKELDLTTFLTQGTNKRMLHSLAYIVSNHSQPHFWPLIESLSKYDLIIVPPVSDSILVLDETKDFSVHQAQLNDIDYIRLGVVLESGEILLLTETNFKESDLKILFSYHDVMPKNNCNSL